MIQIPVQFYFEHELLQKSSSRTLKAQILIPNSAYKSSESASKL
jgi:hypothetical protein